ncbi:glutamate receptor ionotropic, kainate 2-like isoform X3 [Artemia franciscana]|uniref:Glutamate receptor 1 n=1 Tax=Artemia franciscana TaxID=6661 RepID=A0AA88I3Y1_ARTSF|nr:hypothetical protein QYM36_009816 [Artemia franciscana]
MCFIGFYLFLSVFIYTSNGIPDSVRILGLFESENQMEEIAFRYAVDRVNSARHVLPRTRVLGQVERVSLRDSFTASKKVCNFLRYGLVGVFGPSSDTATHIQSLCDAFELPHVETRYDRKRKRYRDDSAVNLYPHPETLSKAYYDLVKSWGWKNVALLYEQGSSLTELQELMKAQDINFHLKELPLEGDVRPLLKEIRKDSISQIVLACSSKRILDILRQANQVGLISTYHSYVLTSLDLQTVDLAEFRDSGVNITGYSIIDPTKSEVANAVSDWVFGELRYGRALDLTEKKLTVSAALIYDAVLLFSKALHDLDRSQDISVRPMNCNSPDQTTYGSALVSYMKLMELDGLTGSIKFDGRGYRTQFSLDIIEYSHTEDFKKIGTWTPSYGTNFTRNYQDVYAQIIEGLQNRTFRVTTILTQPYVMLVPDWEALGLEGNDRFEGFAVELINDISEILKFNYKIHVVEDGNYGSLDANGQWNGMIKELLDQKADVAIGDLSINYDRETAVDFTTPFLNTGISILYKKAQKKPPSLFSFLLPFSVDVWIYMATAYLGVSVLLFILARITPDEWDSPHPCKESDVLENTFNMQNCTWFTIGSLMQQGSDIAPKAVSLRLVAALWWFFTLIMISSYTANLAAFLTVERMDSPIESAEDLAKQTKIKYGCVGSGSTIAFFRDSKIPTYQRMWSFMESARPSVFNKNTPEGIDRVIKSNGGYAFMTESATIEYQTERNCDLVQIGGNLDSKGYGVALPHGSPFTGAFSSAVLQLLESNKILILKTKWWKEKHGGGRCGKKESKSLSSANELGLANVGGVFVVLLLGLIAASIVGLFEFFWKARKLAGDEVESIKAEMFKELKFALSCSGEDTKPVRKRQRIGDSDSNINRNSVNRSAIWKSNGPNSNNNSNS